VAEPSTPRFGAPSRDDPQRTTGALRRGVGSTLMSLTLAMILLGCASDSPAGSTGAGVAPPLRPNMTAADSTAPPSTEDSPTNAEIAVVESYRTALAAIEQTLSGAEADGATLTATVTDPLLSEVVNLSGSWAGFGQVLRYPSTSIRRIDPVSVVVTGDEATIESCRVDDGQIVEQPSGRVLNDEVTTSLDRAVMRRVDGQWKLSTRVQLEKWNGVTGCAAILG
jgi:hypothetical protein